MQYTSDTYATILAGEHRAEWKVEINGTDFTQIKELRISRSAFTDSPTVGACVAAELKVVMLSMAVSIPKMAEVRPFVRIVNDTQQSEWLPKGVFYIDSRSVTKSDGVNWLTINAYDAMLKAEQDCPLNNFPQTDLAAVTEIADVLGVGLDDYIGSQITNSYTIPLPAEYSCREVLGYIAAMYAGSFIIDDFGNLRLVTLNGYPEETNYLINAAGFTITFGGDRIVV